MPAPADLTRWLDRPETPARLRAGFAVALALSLLLELAVEKHPYYGIDGSFGFAAWFGLGACLVLVPVAKLIGILLKRPEAHYDD